MLKSHYLSPSRIVLSSSSRSAFASNSHLPCVSQRRSYSESSSIELASHLPPLPPIEKWSRLFPSFSRTNRQIREIRPLVKQWDTAMNLLSAYGLDKDDGNGPKTIIEAYPGPGLLSRALLSLPRERVKKLVILEAGEYYQDYLHELAKADDRVVFIPESAYLWQTYETVKERGGLDGIEPVLDGSVHPNLRFLAQMPLSVSAEQLISQLIRQIPSYSWLFHYGRIPMHLLMAQWVLERLTAPAGSIHRGKLSALTEATSSIDVVLPDEELRPYNDHFHPRPSKVPVADNSPSFRRAGHPMIPFTLLPLKNQVIKPDAVDAWDFVLRQLFILSKSPLNKALPRIASGAGVLLKNPCMANVDPEVKVHKMNTEDLTALLQAFTEWPFAPKDLVLTDGGMIRVGTRSVNPQEM